MRIDIFYTPGCHKCVANKEGLRNTAEGLIPNLDWHELNVLDEIDYAIDLGVVILPALAIDREVVFASLPTSEQLKQELIKRISKEV